MWNPINKLREKIMSAAANKAAENAIGKAAAQGSGGMDLKALEKSGMLGKFLRHWKSPAFLSRIRAVGARMRAEGVNVKDAAAVKAWIGTHQKEIEAGEISAPTAPGSHTPFVKTGPDLGRNDPCKCGSGKKFKKCCGK